MRDTAVMQSILWLGVGLLVGAVVGPAAILPRVVVVVLGIVLYLMARRAALSALVRRTVRDRPAEPPSIMD